MCRDGYLRRRGVQLEGDDWRIGNDAMNMERVMSPEYRMVAPETAMEPMERVNKPDCANCLRGPVVNGTKFHYIMIRKGGSRLIESLLSALDAHEKARSPRSPAFKPQIRQSVTFTFVLEPFAKLVSGYHEIVERHLDRDSHYCKFSKFNATTLGKNGKPKKPHWICGQAFRRMRVGSAARFEEFVKAMFLKADFKRDLDGDALSYHVKSMVASTARFAPIGFIGRLETLRESFLDLLAFAVDDPEAYVESSKQLRELLKQKEARPARSGVRQGGPVYAACLSKETRRVILDHFGQDFDCFGYPSDMLRDDAVPPEGTDCGALTWRT